MTTQIDNILKLPLIVRLVEPSFWIGIKGQVCRVIRFQAEDILVDIGIDYTILATYHPNQLEIVPPVTF